jgi:long-chain acyl-CoA synthetase
MGFSVVRSPLCAALERQVVDQSRRVAIHSAAERVTVTFAELGERISARAQVLSDAGVREGETAALAMGNVLAFPECFFALRSLGVAVIVLDEGMSVAAARMGARWILTQDTPRRLEPETTVPAGTALVKLTSGSTLDPRGACFTEEALLAGIDHILLGMELTSANRVLLSIPLSHSYGFDNGVLSLAVGGTPLFLQQDILPAAILQALREHEITFFPAVPPLIRALGRVAWPRPLALRKVICASAPLSREAAEEFTRASGIPVRQFYGATECGGISFESRPGETTAEGCVGFPLPAVRIELGETLRVHSKANRFALLPDQPVTSVVETGDRAMWTPEGRLKLLGRAARVANIGGIKVDLGALETFFRTLPGVEEASIVAADDPARGHRIVAYVETSAYTPDTLLRICREKLSAREVPCEIQVVPRLPRTLRGKPDLAALEGGR